MISLNRFRLVKRGFQIHSLRSLSQQVAVAESDTKPLYPPVKPKYPPGKWGRMSSKHAWKWYNQGAELLKIENCKERLEAFSEKSRPGYWQLTPFMKRHHSLSAAQYMTKTRVKHQVADFLSQMNFDEKILGMATDLMQNLYSIQQMVECAENMDAEKNQALLRQMVTMFCSLADKQNPHVKNYQVSENARVESAWQRWGYEHPTIRTTTKDDGGCRFQVSYKPNFLVRSEHPLMPIMEGVDSLLPEEVVPTFTYSPNCFGFQSDSVKPKWLPGFQFGDPCEFGAVQVIDISDYLAGAESELNFGKHPQIVQELMDSCAVLAGNAWASSLAHYQGFNMHHDLTYPFCVNTILTDTKRVIVSTYQLNTLALNLDGEGENANQKENACWTSQLMTLNDADGKISNEAIKLILSAFA